MIITLPFNGIIKQGDILSGRSSTKFNEAIIKSRILLGSSAPKSMVRKTTQKDRRSLVGLTKTERRPVFERIIEPILAETPRIQKVKLNKTKLKDEKSKRFRVETLDDSTIEEELYQISRKPIWKEVLDEQRTQLSKRTISESIQQDRIAEQRLKGLKSWPHELPQNKNYSFLNWLICSENIQATKLSEEVIEHAGYRFNPLLIMGKNSTGKSHLSWAIGQSIQRINGNSSVRLISCSTLNLDDFSENEWSETLTLSKAIIVENISEIFENVDACIRLSKVLEWALNIGVQIIITCKKSSIDEFPRGKLLDVLSSSVRCQLNEYSKFSLITMLRTLSTKRNVILNDNVLEEIVNSSDGKWPSCQSIFESVCMALESGASVDSRNDIEAIIEGRPHSIQVASGSDETLISDDRLAREIGKAAIQNILNSKENSEQHVDNMFNDIVDDELLKRPLVSHSGEPWFGGELPSKVTARIRNEMESLSDDSLEAMIDVGLNFEQRAIQLQNIENEMIEISNLIEHSNTTELLDLADRLIQLDSELSNLKTIDNKKGKNEFDEYTPEGEWNIDEDDVTIEELFDVPLPKIKRKAKRRTAKRKGKIHFNKKKRNVLIPIDSEAQGTEIKLLKTLVPESEEE